MGKRSSSGGVLLSNRKLFSFSLVFFLVLVAFHLYSKKQPEGKEAENMFQAFKRPLQWQGKYPSDFEIQLTNGEKFILSENIGKKVIVLNFFATWCEPCRSEIPELNSFFEKHRDDPFVMIGINDGESRQKVETFVGDYQVKFSVAIDKDNALQKLFTVRSFPTTVYIGTDGRVQIYEIGPIMNADIAFDALFKKDVAAASSGQGIRKEAYLEAIKNQKNLSQEESKDEEKDEVRLAGRAKTIAEEMYCPCGCSDILKDCSFKTAKDIKEKLSTQNLAGKSDEEIIKELDKEFCVKGGKSRHD